MQDGNDGYKIEAEIEEVAALMHELDVGLVSYVML